MSKSSLRWSKWTLGWPNSESGRKSYASGKNHRRSRAGRAAGPNTSPKLFPLGIGALGTHQWTPNTWKSSQKRTEVEMRPGRMTGRPKLGRLAHHFICYHVTDPGPRNTLPRHPSQRIEIGFIQQPQKDITWIEGPTFRPKPPQLRQPQVEPTLGSDQERPREGGGRTDEINGRPAHHRGGMIPTCRGWSRWMLC
jgi:hypothetical protein